MQLTPQQKNQFMAILRNAQKLQEKSDIVQRRVRAIDLALEWFKNKTGALPPSMTINSDILGKIRGLSPTLAQQTAALTFGIEQLRGQGAALQLSTRYPGDFDIVSNAIPVTDQMKANLFKRDTLGAAFLIPFIPLLVKAGTVVITAVIVYGITDAVTETIQKTNSIDADVKKVQADIERDIAQDPALFKTWSKFKTQTMNKDDWTAQIQKTGGSLVVFALIIMAGAMIFKHLGKGGDKK